ncbi:MAG: ACP S-malonyltransferase [Campylobacterota bacterium]|nr:ACP S-malonyltransferase [Campylobacterota bacterium]
MKKIGFIFPGQGSQSIGMGKDFYENNQIAKDMIKNSSNRLGFDFEELLFNENEKLGQTQFTQPAILLVSCIALEIFKSKCNIKPEFVLGHSLGEFSALVASGAIDYLDAIELVYKRGLFMNEACEGAGAGMMALVGLTDEKVETIAKEQRDNGKQIWAANYNMDGQIVVAGIKSDLENLVDTFKEAGAKRAIVLDMSVASHCPLLNSAVDKLSPYLNDFINDNFNSPIISNVTAKEYNTKDEACELLGKQLISPVKYKHSIIDNAQNIDMFIEFGNGAVLKGLNRKIVKSIPTLNVNNMKNLEETIGKIND